MIHEEIRKNIIKELSEKVSKAELEIINFDISNLCEYFENKYTNYKETCNYETFLQQDENKRIINLYSKLCLFAYVSEIIKLKIYNRIKELSALDDNYLPEAFFLKEKFKVPFSISLKSYNKNLQLKNSVCFISPSMKNITKFSFYYTNVLLSDIINQHINKVTMMELISSAKHIVEVLNSLMDGLIIELYLSSGIMARPFAKFEHLENYINDYFAIPANKKELFNTLESYCPEQLLFHEHFVLTNCNEKLAKSFRDTYLDNGNKCYIVNLLVNEFNKLDKKFYKSTSGYDNKLLSIEYDNILRRIFPFLFKHNIISPTKAYKAIKPITNDWYINGVGSINNTIDTLNLINNQSVSRKIAKEILNREHKIKVYLKNNNEINIDLTGKSVFDPEKYNYYLYDVISLAMPNYSVLDNLINIINKKYKMEKNKNNRIIAELFGIFEHEINKFTTPNMFSKDTLTNSVHKLDIISFDKYSNINLCKSVPEILLVDDFIYNTLNFVELISKCNSILGNDFHTVYISFINKIDKGFELNYSYLKDDNLKHMLTKLKAKNNNQQDKITISSIVHLCDIMHMHLITKYKISRFMSSIDEIIINFKDKFENWLLQDGYIVDHLQKNITKKISNRFKSKHHITKLICKMDNKFANNNFKDSDVQIYTDINEENSYVNYFKHKLNLNTLNYVLFSGFYNNICSKLKNSIKEKLKNHLLIELAAQNHNIKDENLQQLLPKALTKFDSICQNYTINSKIANMDKNYTVIIYGGTTNNNNDITYCNLEHENKFEKQLNVNTSLPSFHNLLRSRATTCELLDNFERDKLVNVLNYTGYKELNYYTNVPIVTLEFGKLYFEDNKTKNIHSNKLISINHTQCEQFLTNKIVISFDDDKISSNDTYNNYDIVNATSTTLLFNKNKEYEKSLICVEKILTYILNNINEVYCKDKLEQLMFRKISDEEYNNSFIADMKTELIVALAKINLLKSINNDNTKSLKINEKLHDNPCVYLETLFNSNNINEDKDFMINIFVFSLNLMGIILEKNARSFLSNNRPNIPIDSMSATYSACYRLIFPLAYELINQEFDSYYSNKQNYVNNKENYITVCSSLLTYYLTLELFKASMLADAFLMNFSIKSIPANLWYQYYIHSAIKLVLKLKCFHEDTIYKVAIGKLPDIIKNNLFFNPKIIINDLDSIEKGKVPKFFEKVYFNYDSVAITDKYNSINCESITELFNKNNVLYIRNHGLLADNKSNLANVYEKNMNFLINSHINFYKSLAIKQKQTKHGSEFYYKNENIPLNIYEWYDLSLPIYSEMINILPMSFPFYKTRYERGPHKLYLRFKSYDYRFYKTVNNLCSDLLIDIGLPIPSIYDMLCNINLLPNSSKDLRPQARSCFVSIEYNSNLFTNDYSNVILECNEMFKYFVCASLTNLGHIYTDKKDLCKNVNELTVKMSNTTYDIESLISHIEFYNDDLLDKLKEFVKNTIKIWINDLAEYYNSKSETKINPLHGSCLHSSYCFLNSKLMTNKAKDYIYSKINEITTQQRFLEKDVIKNYNPDKNSIYEKEYKAELILTPPVRKFLILKKYFKQIPELNTSIFEYSEEDWNSHIEEIVNLFKETENEAFNDVEMFVSKLVPIHVKTFEIGSKIAKRKEHLNQNNSAWLKQLYDYNRQFVIENYKISKFYDETVDYYHLNSLKCFPHVNIASPKTFNTTIFNESILNADKYMELGYTNISPGHITPEINFHKNIVSILNTIYNPVGSYYETIFNNNELNIKNEQDLFSTHELILLTSKNIFTPMEFIKQQERIFNTYLWITKNIGINNPIEQFEWKNEEIFKTLISIYLMIPYVHHYKIDVINSIYIYSLPESNSKRGFLNFSPMSYLKTVYNSLFDSVQFNLKNHTKISLPETRYKSLDVESEKFTIAPYISPQNTEILRTSGYVINNKNSSVFYNNHVGHFVGLIRQEYLNPIDLLILMQDMFSRLVQKEEIFKTKNKRIMLLNSFASRLASYINNIKNGNTYKALKDEKRQSDTVYKIIIELFKNYKTEFKSKQKNNTKYFLLDTAKCNVEFKSSLLDKKYYDVNENKIVSKIQSTNNKIMIVTKNVPLIQNLGVLKEALAIKYDKGTTQLKTETEFEADKTNDSNC